MDRWEGKVAVVTGASAGIGAAIVEVLAKAGVQVVGLARRLDRLEQLAAQLGGPKGNVYARQCDVSKEEDILNALRWVESELGGVDILVNNAGICRCKKIIDDDADSYRDILNVNVLALAIAINKTVASIKKRDVPGHIININSLAGHFPLPAEYSFSLYAASKYAVTALTETVRKELATDANNKIRITSISPGGVRTEIAKAAGLSDADNLMETATHILEPVDIANAVVYVLGAPQSVLHFKDRARRNGVPTSMKSEDDA